MVKTRNNRNTGCQLIMKRQKVAKNSQKKTLPFTRVKYRICLIVALQIWSSGLSLKRPSKMQFRRIDLMSIGPPSQKLRQNQIWPKLRIVIKMLNWKSMGDFCLWVFLFDLFVVALHMKSQLYSKKLAE